MSQYIVEMAELDMYNVAVPLKIAKKYVVVN